MLKDRGLERSRGEFALRESEDRFRTTFAHASVGMAMATPEGRYLEALAAFEWVVYAAFVLVNRVVRPNSVEA